MQRFRDCLSESVGLEYPRWASELLAVNRDDPSPRRRKPAAKRPSAWQQVRPAKVAKAKQLLKNKQYPPPEVLNSVAHLLARNLRSGEELSY